MTTLPRRHTLKQKRSMKSPWTGFSVRPLRDTEKKYFPTEKNTMVAWPSNMFGRAAPRKNWD